MRKYTVICEWELDASTFDADEFVVHADSTSSAIAKAKKKWRLTTGAECPACRMTKVFILTPKKLAQFL